MTPQTLDIDRKFRGVGRIKKRSGTTVPAVKRKMDRMLTALYDEGRLDILRAIRDDKPGCSLMEVLEAYTRKALGALPVGDTAARLGVAFAAWVDEMQDAGEYSTHHIRAMQTTKGYLSDEQLAPTFTAPLVHDLPAVLEHLRKTLGRKHPRSFNLTRSHGLAFLRKTLKKSHALYIAATAVERVKVPKRTKGSGLPPAVFRNYFPAPATDPVDAMAWSMATMGTNVQEYFEGVWTVQGDRIHIAGTKRAGRVRDVPLLMIPREPTMHRRTWEDAVRLRFAGTGHVPNDMRRSYSHWLELAKIPRTRRRLYIGHGTKDVTDLYEQHEVDAYLRDDATALRALLDLPGEPVRRLEIAK